MATGSPRSWIWLKTGNKRKLKTSLFLLNMRRNLKIVLPKSSLSHRLVPLKNGILERYRIRRLLGPVRLDIWAQVSFRNKTAPVWLGFCIPADLMVHLRFSPKNTALQYAGHQHTFNDKFFFPAFTLESTEKVPFPSDFIDGMKSAVIGSKVYCFGGNWEVACMQGITKESDIMVDRTSIFHRPRYLDFSSKINTTQWEIGEPFCSPRYSPQTLLVEDKLYVFGGSDPSGCFAEVFDPMKGCWEALPGASFGLIPSDRLIVAFGPSPQILLLNTQDDKAYLYHPSTRSWDTSYDWKFSRQLSRMHGQPITVDNTLFWLDKDGNIYAFDWETGKLLSGPVAGLWHELKCRDGCRMSVLSLFHLVDELFCLVWRDQSRGHVHVTIIRVRKEPVETRLFVVAVACMRYKLRSMSTLECAHLL